MKKIHSGIFFVPGWSYIDLEFTPTDIILSLNIPVSFVILVMTSTAWHYFELHKKDTLTLTRQIKVMPFFLPSIFMKMGVLITSTSYLSDFCQSLPLSSCAIFTLLLILLTYQIVIHKHFSFKISEKDKDDSVIISIFGNLTSNARPKTAENECVLKFFRTESVTSALLYTALAACNAAYIALNDEKNIDEEFIIFIGFSVILLHVLFTQLYLWTSTGQRLLFPEDEETNQTVVTSQTKAPQLELKAAKWILLFISIAITAGLFCYIGFILHTQGKNPNILFFYA